MKSFGETVRELRVAQDLGLRETALKVGISPAYLSRIERGKEKPPKPEVVKALAKHLAADPDVLFRLSDSTDPELAELLHHRKDISDLIRRMKALNLSVEGVQLLHNVLNELENVKASTAS